MKFNPEKHHRRSIRLKDYDYSAGGAYFITICTFQRQCLFGNITNAEMELSPLGKIVANEWLRTPQIRPNFELNEWIVMPNHIHGIIIINSPKQSNDGFVGAHSAPLPDISVQKGIAYRRPRSLSSFISGFKSATTKQINIQRDAAGTPTWQRNYYDHIIRNDKSLQYIRQYIQNNPATWQDDQLNPNNLSKF